MSSRDKNPQSKFSLLLTPDEELDTGDYIRKLFLMDDLLGVVCWAFVIFLAAFGLLLIASVALAAKQSN
jgi:hypothetical protein